MSNVYVCQVKMCICHNLLGGMLNEAKPTGLIQLSSLSSLILFTGLKCNK